MALDLKIEIFARYIIYDALFNVDIMKTKTKILPIFGEECCKVENCVEVCDMMFGLAVICRRKMFGRIYLADFTYEKSESLKSSYDCYDYVTSICDRDDLFGHLTVFERMLATCGFVIDFCILIHEHNIVDVVKYGPMFWAMYFDKFTAEFYTEGGWAQLREVARKYSNIYDIYLNFNEREFHILGKAIEDYYEFMDTDQYYEYKENNLELKTIHVSKLWIQYNVARFESCTKNPITYQYYVKLSEIEELLQNLKDLYDCISKNPICDDMETSETSDDYDTYLESLSVPEVLPTDQMDVPLSYRNTLLYSVPGATDVCTEKGGVIDSVAKEARAKKILEVKHGSNIREDQKKIAMRTEIISTIQSAQSKSDRKDFSCIPTRHVTDNLYSGNTKMPSVTPTASQALSKNQIDVSICYGKPPPYCDPEATNFSSEKAENGSFQNVPIEKLFEVNCSLKNGDQQTEIVEGTEVISTRNVIKSEIDLKFQNIPIERCPEILYSRIMERSSEMPYIPGGMSYNELDVSLLHRKPLEYCFSDTMNFSLEDGDSGEQVHIEKTLEVDCLPKNKDDWKGIPKTKEIQSTKKMAKSELNVGCPTDILPEILNLENRCEYTNDEMEKNVKARESLKNEKDDHDINIFLRMILVLGDRHGTKLMFQALTNSKDISEKTQSTKSKQSKKAKEKK